MKYVINIPNYSYFSNPDNLMTFARVVEESGWDGLFIWDHLQLFPEYFRGTPFIDPYVGLTLIASVTDRIMLGPYITPLARRRPWQVYRQLVSIDQLSKGRVILGVGLGYPPQFEFGAFGDETDDRIRAEMLDEGLEIIRLLSSGEEISYPGKHYQLDKVQLLPKPYRGSIPIYVAGQWPNKPPFRRAAQFDGVLPISNNWPEQLTPQDVVDLKEYITQYRNNDAPFDIVVGGQSTVDRSEKIIKKVRELEDAGATWWCEDMDSWGVEFEEQLERVQLGPPH